MLIKPSLNLGRIGADPVIGGKTAFLDAQHLQLFGRVQTVVIIVHHVQLRPWVILVLHNHRWDVDVWHMIQEIWLGQIKVSSLI